MRLLTRSTTLNLLSSILAGSLMLALQGCGGGSGDSGGNGENEQQAIPFDPQKIDLAYGIQGAATISLGLRNTSQQPLATLQKDGKLLIVFSRVTAPLPAPGYGRPSRDVFVQRLNANGSLDSGFGTNGETKITVMGSDAPADIKVQANGRILIAIVASEPCIITDAVPENYCRNSSGVLADQKSVIAALTPAGAIDNNFGARGFAYSAHSDVTLTLALQPDQQVLLLRSSVYVRGLVFGRSISRFSVDGIADASFEQQTNGTPPCEATGDAITVLNNGNIVTAGTHTVRYGNPAVHPGICFATHSRESGRQTSGLWTSFGSNYKFISLHAGSNDSLSAVGEACIDTRCELTISRHMANGSLDMSYGTNGIARFPTPFQISSSFMQPDGSIVVYGQQATSGSTASTSASWMYIDPTGSPVKNFGVGGIFVSPSSTFLPVNAVQDSEGRWLLLSKGEDAAGNSTVTVRRTQRRN